jgi:hypothetical protein
MSELSDLLERFRRGAELLSVATTGASNQELDFAPAPGKWTPRQIACHLADAEYVGAMRLRQVIAEDNPSLVGFDEQKWTANLNYASRKISAILEAFRRVRLDNFELLKSLPPEAFERYGTHSEDGRLTLQELLKGYAEHAENHVKQIMAARQAYKNK